MPTRILIALVLLIAAPLLVLGWLSTSAIDARDAAARESLQAIFEQRLSESASAATRMLDEFQATLVSAANQEGDRPSVLAMIRRSEPLARQTVWVDRQGRMLYPQRGSNASPQQESEIQLLEELIRGRPTHQSRGKDPQQNSSPVRSASQTVDTTELRQESYWGVWYFEQGLQLVLWIPGDKGDYVGILLNRSAWMSELVAQLPASDATAATNIRTNSSDSSDALSIGARTTLLDAEERRLYQWYVTPTVESGVNAAIEPIWYAVASVPLPAPLSGWKLRYETQQPLLSHGYHSLPIVLALLGIGVLFVALGIYLATSLQRQLRLAAQQVSFSTQVSHELRTPLTNIRLYTEMAESDIQSMPLSSQTESVARRLQVIRMESQRLSRLCANVLELVREPRSRIASKITNCEPDVCIDTCLEQFLPSLERLQFQIERSENARCTMAIDQHALETVVINVLSNIEKYAAEGKWLRIESRVEGNELAIRIADHGPGIPRRQWKRIFQPFVRLQTGVNAPNGTGIGLAIANQATRHAGGTLQIVPADRGTCMELRLPIEQES